MRIAIPLLALVLLIPSAVNAQAPSVGRSISVACQHYAGGRFEQARQTLVEARDRNPDMAVLLSWHERLLEEMRSPEPAPELRLVPAESTPVAFAYEAVAPAPPRALRESEERELDRALSPAHQTQSWADFSYAVGIPLFAMGAGTLVSTVFAWAFFGSYVDEAVIVGGLVGAAGGLVLGGLIWGIAWYLDGRADEIGAQIERSFTLSISPSVEGVVVTAHQRF